MQEIILYAVFTLIMGGMLVSVLGKNVGQGPDAAIDPEKLGFGHHDMPAVDTPVFEGPAAEGLCAIAAKEPGFSQYDFIEKAKMAYGMILDAYADGDKDMLGDLLNDEVGGSYFAAIDDRIQKNLTQKTDLARLISADIVNAHISGKTGYIDVKYKAELATALLDKDKNIVQGDLEVLSRVTEVWRYERVVGSKSPIWILSSVSPHDSDGPESPDHSPDTV